MKNTEKTIVNETKTIIEVIKTLKPREAVDGKKYPEYKKGLEAVLDAVYAVYQAREKGTATKEAESEAMQKVTAFLHTLGKANGKYISVCEKTTENGISSVLFDTLVYHSFRDRIYTTSPTLATLECEKQKASKEKTEAHEKLINGKGTATAYKEAVKAYDEAVKAVQTEREKAGAENTLTEKESISKFVKFTTARLKAIIENRYAISPEEAEKLRKLHNKETKEKRNAKPEAEAPKTEKTKATEKKTTKPKTTATKKNPEAPKVSKATLEKVKEQQEAQKPEAKPEAEKKTA